MVEDLVLKTASWYISYMSRKMMDFKIAKKTIRIYDVKGYGRVQTGRVLKFYQLFCLNVDPREYLILHCYKRVGHYIMLKFIYFEKATKFCEIFTLLL